MNKRQSIAESTSQCFPSKVKESSLHIEKPSLVCLDLVSLCPNLEAVKSNASTFGGKEEEGNESQDTISRLFRAQSIKAEPDTKELIGSQCRLSSSGIKHSILQMFSNSHILDARRSLRHGP